MIDDNILKTIKLKNIIKLWRKKIIGQTNFILVITIAEVSCVIDSDLFLRDLSVLSIYRSNEQNHLTSALC